MNRIFTLGIALFVAIVAISLTSGERKADAAFGFFGCGCSGAPACCGPVADTCCGPKREKCCGLFGRKCRTKCSCAGNSCSGEPACSGAPACCGRTKCCGRRARRRCCGTPAPSCCGTPAPTCAGSDASGSTEESPSDVPPMETTSA